jgi:hypothetical protein
MLRIIDERCVMVLPASALWPMKGKLLLFLTKTELVRWIFLKTFLLKTPKSGQFFMNSIKINENWILIFTLVCCWLLVLFFEYVRLCKLFVVGCRMWVFECWLLTVGFSCRCLLHCKKSWRSSSTPASGDAGPIHTGVKKGFRHPCRRFYYKYRTFFYRLLQMSNLFDRTGLSQKQHHLGANLDSQIYFPMLYHCTTLSSLFKSTLKDTKDAAELHLYSLLFTLYSSFVFVFVFVFVLPNLFLFCAFVYLFL